MKIGSCYDNQLQQYCSTPPAHDQGLTGWAWVIIITVAALVLFILACYLSARMRENRIIREGGDPYIHVGGMKIRPSTAKAIAASLVWGHVIRHHQPITQRPAWRDEADKYSNDLWHNHQEEK